MNNANQLALFDSVEVLHSPAVTDALETMALFSESGERGAVFTRSEVVDFILDLTGYVPSKDIWRQRILEPSFGGGDFLLSIIARLLSSYEQAHDLQSRFVFDDLRDAIHAVELHRSTCDGTHGKVCRYLMRNGLAPETAKRLTNAWLQQGDFLLQPIQGSFDYVVGNPPYVRQELIPGPLLDAYRYRYRTLYDRADLYIPFIERALRLLQRNGTLGFICADRWLKNRYGGPLRKFVAQGFHLKVCVDMLDTSAFYTDVSAYPAIVIISRDKPGKTRFARCTSVTREALNLLASDLLAPELSEVTVVQEFDRVANNDAPWLMQSSQIVNLIHRLESQYPTIQQADCKIGIGVATGADKVFIGDYRAMEVEGSRKLPLVTTNDIKSGSIVWSGKGVINPFEDNGGLVAFAAYPKLAAYLETHKAALTSRHCAQKNTLNWYRTIDRIWPELVHRPKLLIPDIKGEAHVVFDSGEFYPHHNLYYVTSEIWDLRALQAVLLSKIARLFIANYSTQMRGGYLRFQAQYLRRIRIPYWYEIDETLRSELHEAGLRQDRVACDQAVVKLYKLTQDEQSVLN